MNIAVGSQGIWRRFAPLLGLDPHDPRFATNEDRVERVEELVEEISLALKERPVAEWMERFTKAGVPAGRIRTIDEVYGWDQIDALGLVRTMSHPVLGEIRLPGLPVHFNRFDPGPPAPPPLLGADTEDVVGDRR